MLELGGKDPQIVCADADLGNAISGCVWGGFANAGQTCSGIERTYVVKEVADRFIEGVVRRAEELNVGDPLEWDTEIGPMVSEDQYEIVTELVDDALGAGAERVPGGRARFRASAASSSRPTVLAGVEDEMRIMSEEIFGPVVPIIVVDGGGRRRRANDSNFGSAPPSGQGPGQGRADRAADRVRDGLDQRPFVHARRLPVLLGRGEGIGTRALPLQVRLLRVRGRQARLVGAGGHAGSLVAAVRPHPGRGLRASARLLYGRNGQRLRALREGGLPLVRASARTLRKDR